MNKTIKNILLFSFTAVLLWFSLKNLELSKLKEAWQETNFFLLTLTSFIAIFSHVIRAERWKLMLTPLGHKVSLKNSFYAVMIGYFVNLAIPRGGELSRCVSLKKSDNVPLEQSLGTVLAERIIDLVFMLLLIGVTLLIEFKKIMTIMYDVYGGLQEKIASISLAFVLIFLFSFIFFLAILFYLYKKGTFDRLFQKVKGFLIGLKEGIFSLFKLRKISLFMLHSIVIWVSYYFMTYYGMKAFPSVAHLGASPALTIFVAGGIAMIIPLPGGTGSYHTIIPTVLLLYAISPTDGASFATIFHLWQTLTIILVGSICLLLGQVKSKSTGLESA